MSIDNEGSSSSSHDASGFSLFDAVAKLIEISIGDEISQPLSGDTSDYNIGKEHCTF